MKDKVQIKEWITSHPRKIESTQKGEFWINSVI